MQRSSILFARSRTAMSQHHAVLTAAVIVALTAPAVAQLQFEELSRKGLPVVFNDTQSLALGDVDGDGDIDIVSGNFIAGGPELQNRLYLNDGTGTFTDETAQRMPLALDSTTSVALGDVDGDGDLDIVFGNAINLNGQQNRLYLNNGAGTFTDATVTHMPAGSESTLSVALGDVDGDGDLDLVAGNGNYLHFYGQQNRLYLNNGAGTFTDTTATHMPVDTAHTTSLALGDVDGDGDLDMVVGNNERYPIYLAKNGLYLNDGNGTFTDATATHVPFALTNTYSLALGDVDGDGDIDLVTGNGNGFYGNLNRLYLNNGAGMFTDATVTNLPWIQHATRSLALGDIDGDGDLDLVTGNWGQDRLYLNDGQGTFADVTVTRGPTIVTSDITFSLALGDVDGDEDLDMVVGNNLSNQSRLHLNLQRELHAPNAPHVGQPYSLDAYMRHGTSSIVNLAAVYLSTASASMALPPFGTLGIDPAFAVPFPTLMVPQPAGVGNVGFTVPNVPSLVGQVIYSQAMLVAYPSDLRLSNVVADVILP